MFYAPGLLYLHMPRTGGTFVSNLLEKHKLGSRQFSMEIGGHDGIRMVPEQVTQRSLVFATLRDPWSWYASIDAHYRHRGRFDGALHEYFKRAVPFKELMLGFTHPAASSRIPLQRSSRFPGSRLPEDRLPAKIQASGVGLYTWMVLRLFCREPLELVPGIGGILDQYTDIPWAVNAIVDTAQLRDGLSDIVSAWRPDIGTQIEADIRQSAPQNEKSRFRGVLPTGGPDPAVFDAEAQGWVSQYDGWLIRRFGFDKPVGQRPAVTLIGR